MTDRGPSEFAEAEAQRVYVVDDHLEMCQSLEALLSSFGYLVSYFTDPLEFIGKRAQLLPGLVLLDLRMPQMTGLEVLSSMKMHLAQFPTVVITAHGEIDSAVKAIKLGARDFIQKPFREDALLEVIRAAAEGLDSAGSRVPAALDDELSPRERDVVLALSRGVPNKVVAYELGISVRTVEMHRARAMQKLGCKTFADLLRRVINAPPAAH